MHRQQCSTRNLHEDRFGKGATPFDRRVVDTGSVSQEGVPASVWADIGTKAHTSERLTSLLRQMPLRLREGQTKALACLTLMDEEHRASKVVMDES